VSKEGGRARDSLEAVWLHHISARASRDRDARTPARSPSADLLANRTPRPGLTALVASFSTADTTMVRDRNKGQYEALDGCIVLCGMYGKVLYGTACRSSIPGLGFSFSILTAHGPMPIDAASGSVKTSSMAETCHRNVSDRPVPWKSRRTSRYRSAGRWVRSALA
jgi:hypothetical protein